MEVGLNRGKGMGCLVIGTGIMTLGLVPLILRLLDRRLVRHMDDVGFDTRSGMRIAWLDVTKVRLVIVKAQESGATMQERLEIKAGRRSAVLAVTFADHPKAALEYALSHIPPSALQA